MKEVLNKMVKSRKFWYGFTTVMLVLFSNHLGISPVKVNTLCTIAVALIIAQGVADINKCQKKECKKK
jgi:hypothetical protein